MYCKAECWTDRAFVMSARTRELFMSLVIDYWIGDIQDSKGLSYIVSGGALNHSLQQNTNKNTLGYIVLLLQFGL